MPVAGIQIAGALPASLQKTTVYSAEVLKASGASEEATDLLALLVSSEGRHVFALKGLACRRSQSVSRDLWRLVISRQVQTLRWADLLPEIEAIGLRSGQGPP